MSTDDEQRVRNTHYSRITCNGPGCPGQVRHVDSAHAHSGRHGWANRAAARAIPGDGPAVSPGGSSSAAARTPRGSIQPAAGAGSRTRCRRGSPRDGASGTVRRSWSLLCSVRGTTESPHAEARRPSPAGLSGWGVRVSGRLRDQAALARRMRRRRSAERSSSFRPPQVPYFSGRETA